MLIIPELEKVVILIPRTGTGTLYRAVLAKYPKAFLLYRHMEADGVPRGYDRWERCTIVRHPLNRLWSLYNWLQTFSYEKHNNNYVNKMRESVNRPFEDWLLNNEIPFSTPYDSAYRGRFYPEFTCNHPIPENRKSQFKYARPDLGTNIYHFSKVDLYYKHLGINDVDTIHNANDYAQNNVPILSTTAIDYMHNCFAWDLEFCNKFIRQ